jgi:dipeptidyl aminopeptidase/acylaminoacyl peptidase
MRFSFRCVTATFVMAYLINTCVGASISSDLIARLYQPLQAEHVALSPDGERLAYTRNEGGELTIYIMAVGRTDRKIRISVEADREVAFSKERAPARLRFLRWASGHQLVFASTSPGNGVRMLAPIHVVNLDGTAVRTLVTEEDFAIGSATRQTKILGFRTGNRNALLVEARGRPTQPPQPAIPTSLFSVDVQTGKFIALTEEYPDGRYLYDQAARARILYTHPRRAEERTFSYQGPGSWSRWVTIDEGWGGALVQSFRVSVDNYYRERAFPLGFASDPKVLFYASNVGRDTFAIYALDVESKRPIDHVIEDPRIDLTTLEPGDAGDGLVLDELRGDLLGVRATGVVAFTRWLNAELSDLQREMDQKFPQRTVEILQWDDARTRFLLRVTGGIEPGRYHVFLREENVLAEVVRSAPWLRNSELNAGTPFSFSTPGGTHLTGYLTFPRNPRLKPPPLIIMFSDGLIDRAQPGFDRDAQVLSSMGLVVARLNHRGGGGFGLAHRNAIRVAMDKVPVEDAVAAIDWIAQHHGIDRQRIAAFGRGLGGYLALRAAQLQPEAFRCAIAMQSPIDPEAWLQPPPGDFGVTVEETPVIRTGARPIPPSPPINFAQEAQRRFFESGKSRFAGDSILRTIDQLSKPLMLIVDPPRDRVLAAQNATLRSALKRRGQVADYMEVESGFEQGLPAARAKVFRRIEEFFNLNLYDYNVKVGPTKEIK